MNLRNIKKILIIKSGALGDLVAATPALRAVRESFPQVEVSVLSNSLFAQIVPPGTLVDKFIDFNLNRSLGLSNLYNNIRFIIYLRRLKFDVAVNLRWNSDRSALLAFLSGAPIRISSGPKNLMFLYTIKSEYPSGRYHEIDRNLDIVKDIGATTKNTVPYVYISDDDKQFAEEFIGNHNLYGEDVICVHPGASRQIRAWRKERFSEIIRCLIEKYRVKVILTWGPGEKFLVEEIASALGANCIIAPETKTIGKLAAVISVSDLFISNCTGPMNVAVAVDTNVVAILGSSDPKDWGPYGEKHRIIKSPLLLESYSDEDEERAMDQIDVSTVWKTVEKRWLEIKKVK